MNFLSFRNNYADFLIGVKKCDNVFVFLFDFFNNWLVSLIFFVELIQNTIIYFQNNAEIRQNFEFSKKWSNIVT